jgi:hypothetical protein
VLASDGRGGRVGRGSAGGVLTKTRAPAERRCDGGNELQWLELGAIVKEGSRELRREGEKGR